MIPRLLVIDDSAFQRRELDRLLTGAGYEVLEARNGRQGLELITARRLDLVLVDLIMPGMGGLEVLEAMQQRGLQTPVVVLSAGEPDSVRAQCRELGAVAVIDKPASKNEVLAVVKRVLGIDLDQA